MKEETGFRHGVASFDPVHDGVIIWTRFTPADASEVVQLDWQVSASDDFSSPAASGTAMTDASRDFTLAVEVPGLQPASRYFYRFSSGKLRSVTGITKTAPAGHVEELTFGVVSCANWGFGHFHVYDMLSKADGLDFVVHCGDYIYEYQKREYPGSTFLARHGLRPKHHCRTLADYRQRYACYRSDPALQELHRRVPMICINDDHEIADDASKQTAEDFNGSRKEFEALKKAAAQAYFEWIPVRGAKPGDGFMATHRMLAFGDLLTLMLVENRVSHRSPPLDVSKTEFYKQTAAKEMPEWDEERILPARDDLLRQMADPSRSMLGEQQVQNVAAAVKASVDAGQPWQVLVNGTIVAPIKAPRLLETVNLQPRLLAWLCRKALKTATSAKRAGKEAAEQARQYIAMGKFRVPMNPAAYDGFQAEREKLLQLMAIPGSNPVALAGDSHNAWAHELVGPRGERLGVEFDTPAVTSPGFLEDIYSRFVEKVGRLAHVFPLWLFTPWVEDALKTANPDTLRFCNLDHKGLVLLHATHAKLHAEFHFVDSITKESYEHYCGAAFDAEVGSRGRLKKAVRYMTINGEVPRVEKPKRGALLRAGRRISGHTPKDW